MIPADVASRMQVSADAALRPVAPAQEITDKLSGLVAGQKVMAEIQSLLPNGTYRALINQRNITLALPFSAKSGDSLELQVTDSDGKLALAVVSRQEGEGGKPVAASTTATLSRTGQLISTLFSSTREAKGGPVALPLNGNQPIASAPPNSAQDLLPLLKQAISQSGMFYESHQAEWVEGRFAKTALLQEPQGKLSSPAAFITSPANEQTSAGSLKIPVTTPSLSNGQPAVDSSRSPADAPRSVGEQSIKATLPSNLQAAADTRPTADVAQNIREQTAKSTSLSNDQSTADTHAAEARQIVNSGSDAGKASAAQTPAQLVAPQTQPIVQQQLEALATQNFSWQGQIWPGQEMHWEINEDAAHREQEGDGSAEKWTTRLRLTLPNLGEIDANIRLHGNQITLAVSADQAETRTLMSSSALALRSQLDAAGLTLASIGVSALTESKTDGQAGE